VNTELKYLLAAQVWQVPYLLVLFFGLVMSLAGRWRGQFVTFAAAGCGVLIFGLLFGAYQQYAMTMSIREGGYSSVMMTVSLWRLASITIHVVGLGLLLAAIFSGRTEPRPARAPYTTS
jgi:hypothetical protein